MKESAVEESAAVIKWLRSEEGEVWQIRRYQPLNHWYGSRPGAFGSLLSITDDTSGDEHEYSPWAEWYCESDETGFLYEPEKLPKDLSCPALSR